MATIDLNEQVETIHGKITVRAYRLFTSNYGWLMVGPGVILATGYFLLAILFGVASIWLFVAHPVAKWLRGQTSWFAAYYLGWSFSWIFLAYFFYPSKDNMGKIVIVLFLNFIHSLALIPSWRMLEAKLFGQAIPELKIPGPN